MSRIILPGEPQAPKTPLTNPKLVSDAILRMFKADLKLREIQRLAELRQSMPRARDEKA